MRWIRLLMVMPLVALVLGAAPAANSTGISSIVLSRTDCLGVCPAYTLSLFSDGGACLHGVYNFALIGRYDAAFINFDDAAKAVISHHFFDLKNAYPTLPPGTIVLDASTTTLTVVRGGKSKSITMTPNESDSSVPASLEELVHIIDGIGFTAYWFDDFTHQPVAIVTTGGRITMSSPDPAKPSRCSSDRSQ